MDETKSHSSLFRGSSSKIYQNPLYEGEERETETREASIRRQTSEPARSKYSVRPIVNRSMSVKTIVQNRTAEFFGLAEDKEEEEKKLWENRRRRLMERNLFGKLKKTAEEDVTGFDVTDGLSKTKDQLTDSTLESRPPVYKMTLGGLSKMAVTLKRKMSKRSPEATKTIAKESASEYSAETPDSFFYPEDFFADQNNFFQKDLEVDSLAVQTLSTDDIDSNFQRQDVQLAQTIYSPHIHQRRSDHKWTLKQISVDPGKLIPENVILENYECVNLNRRKYGLGIVGRIFDRKFKKDLSKDERKAIDHFDDHRPFFTYWITTVQILILLISIYAYGFGHFGIDRAHRNQLVLVSSLSLQQVDHFELENFWIGPRPSDLIHLGAKFTPCMRKDHKIYSIIENQKDLERNTGCCVRNDGSGCIQSLRDNCSPLLSSFIKWNNSSMNGQQYGNKKRTSGPVCGQDPYSCAHPASVEPYEWPDDITKWPICRNTFSNGDGDHMSCKLIGRPCCIGNYGECHITTRDFCDFVRGHFHEEASLCSQVSCMEDVCGMIPFYSKDVPSQFYRLWTPIFLHAGVLHLIITIMIQIFIMRDIEKLTGSLRIGIIYMLSGIGGYLASAVFVPYRAEVGPAGSQFGLLACLFVEIIKSWNLIEAPWKAILKLSSVPTFLFAIGLLPWIDNYAHFFGFVIGFCLSIALLPYITIKEYSRHRKILQIATCLLIVLALFVILVIFLYFFPIENCEFCKFLNCVPIKENWCMNQEIQYTRIDIL